MSKIIERLKQEFQDEDYRYAYDEEFSNSRMATQTRAVREQRGFTQKQLAELTEMKQSRISELENVNYNAWSISTLRRLAKALGVRLFFGFESWGELLPEVETFSRTTLQKPKFEDDLNFKKEVTKKVKSKRRNEPETTNQTQTELKLLQGGNQNPVRPNNNEKKLDDFMNKQEQAKAYPKYLQSIPKRQKVS